MAWVENHTVAVLGPHSYAERGFTAIYLIIPDHMQSIIHPDIHLKSSQATWWVPHVYTSELVGVHLFYQQNELSFRRSTSTPHRGRFEPQVFRFRPISQTVYQFRIHFLHLLLLWQLTSQLWRHATTAQSNLQNSENAWWKNWVFQLNVVYICKYRINTKQKMVTYIIGLVCLQGQLQSM